MAEGPCAGDACSDVFVSPRNVGIEMGRTTDVFLIDMPGGDDLVVLVSLAAVDFALSPTGAVGDLLDSLQLAGVSLDAATTPDVPVIVELPVRPAAPGDG